MDGILCAAEKLSDSQNELFCMEFGRYVSLDFDSSDPKRVSNVCRSHCYLSKALRLRRYTEKRMCPIYT